MAKKQQAATTATAIGSFADAIGASQPAETVVNDTAAPKAIKTTVQDGVLVFTFGTGTVVKLNPSKLTPEIVEQAMIHGLRQKVQDAAAISRDPATGRSATFADKEAAAMEVFNRLVEGHWNKPAGEERDATGGMLLRALMELQPQATADSIKAKIAGWSKEQKAAVRLNPRVKTILDRMAAEKPAVAAIDSEDLLAGL